MKPLISQIHGLPEELALKIGYDQNDITKDPTGFLYPDLTVVTYNTVNRTVTLNGTVQAFFRGKVVSVLTNGWVSIAHTDVNGNWFLYYNGTQFIWSQTIWTFDMLMIAFVNYGVTDKFALREPHGLMPHLVHKALHEKFGTNLKSGGDLSGFVLNSNVAENKRPIISSCIIEDEDISSELPILNSGLYTQLNLSGANGDIVFTKDAIDIVPLLANRPYFNEFTGGSWVQTQMTNNNYQALWLLAIPVTSDTESQKYRFVWIQGQSQSPTLAIIQGLIPANLNLSQFGNLASEFVFIGKVIIRYITSNWIFVQADKLTGNRYNQTAVPVGSYLSAVSTNETLTGDGTVANPLAVNIATSTDKGFVIAMAAAFGR